MTLRKGFTLGDWKVYPLEGRMVSDAEARRVQPKSMDVLLCLADADGAVVERETLLGAVWSKRTPTDEPLTRCISELRRALGDTRSEPEYILTVPKRGYRLLQPVASLANENIANDNAIAPPLTEPQLKIRMNTAKKIAIGAVLLIAAALLEMGIERVLDYRGSDEGPELTATIAIPNNSIVVLPFVNRSSDPEQEYFSDGISEGLLNLLGKIEELRVISRTSAFAYKDRVPGTGFEPGSNRV